MCAHFEEVGVDFREYQPMTSSNKRWSKDELMPQIVRALHVFTALDYSTIRTPIFYVQCVMKFAHEAI